MRDFSDVFSKENFVKSVREYFWSLWFAFPKTLMALGSAVFYCGVWTLFVSLGVPFLGALFIVFLAMLGSNQFSYDVVYKVEQKVGYHIIADRYRKNRVVINLK